MKRPLLPAVALLLCNLSLSAAEPKVLFEERFAAKPGEGWTWLRENPPAWRIADGGLEIRVEPGVAGNVKNALLRKLPDRSKGQFAAEVTVTFKTPPTNQFEQVGFTFYHKGQNGFKLVHEQIDGKTYIIPGKIATATRTVQLRIVYSADKYTAQFRPDGKGEFQTVATGALPAAGDDQLAILCYNGPAEAEHWMRFEGFRIVEVE
jgi:hypothetical protein